jgi:hypothetical protein
MTQKYKCIESCPNLGITFGDFYEINTIDRSFINDIGISILLTKGTLSNVFQKVEPITTQLMKYKVTITSTDLTGHEDVEVQENVSKNDLFLNIDYGEGKTILIEPMPEKQKVTVWFYVYQTDSCKTICSALNVEYIENHRNQMLKAEIKVSEIKSMEVEI